MVDEDEELKPELVLVQIELACLSLQNWLTFFSLLQAQPQKHEEASDGT